MTPRIYQPETCSSRAPVGYVHSERSLRIPRSLVAERCGVRSIWDHDEEGPARAQRFLKSNVPNATYVVAS